MSLENFLKILYNRRTKTSAISEEMAEVQIKRLYFAAVS